MHSTVSNTGRITATTAGKYLIGGHIEFAANATGLRELYIRLNGTTINVNAIAAAGATMTSSSTGGAAPSSRFASSARDGRAVMSIGSNHSVIRSACDAVNVNAFRAIDRFMDHPTTGIVLCLVYAIGVIVSLWAFDEPNAALLCVIGFFWELVKQELRELRQIVKGHDQ